MIQIEKQWQSTYMVCIVYGVQCTIRDGENADDDAGVFTHL